MEGEPAAEHRDDMGRKWGPDPTGRHVWRASEMGRWSDKVKDHVDGPWTVDEMPRKRLYSGPRILAIIGALIIAGGFLDGTATGRATAFTIGAVIVLVAIVFALTSPRR